MSRLVSIGVLAVTVALAMSACGAGSEAAHETLDLRAAGVLHSIARLGSDVQGAQSDLTNFPADLLSERKDFAFVQPNLEATRTAGAHSACADAGNVEAAAQNVATDVSLVQDDIQTFDDGAGQVTKTIAQLRDDEVSLRHDIKSMSYIPAAAPTTQAVSSAISGAETQLGSARLSVARYLRAANHLRTEADDYASQAETICRRQGT